MKVLFVHNNFPAQFRNLAEALVEDPAHTVAAIGSETSRSMPKIQLIKYRMPPSDPIGVHSTHSFARRFDAECRRAEQVLFAGTKLAASGFIPDVIFVHCGWGENLPLRAVYPKARIIVYCEFYYRSEGQDVHFDPEFPRLGIDGIAGLQCKNASTLIALAEGDMGISPTFWQRSTYPAEFHSKIQVAHEGIDARRARPNASAEFVLPAGHTLRKGDEVITFVSRDLEPMRGFHIFMRALPEILKQRPEAHALVVGGDGCSYGPPAPGGASWKALFLNESLSALDISRVHFLNRVSHDIYLKVLQLSSAHIYLTCPFVVSWSLLEAMSAECTIIASDTAPVQEVIDSSRGILVPFLDSGALANAAIEVLANPRRHSAKGKAARMTILERYDKHVCVPQLMHRIGINCALKTANL